MVSRAASGNWLFKKMTLLSLAPSLLWIFHLYELINYLVSIVCYWTTIKQTKKQIGSCLLCLFNKLLLFPNNGFYSSFIITSLFNRIRLSRTPLGMPRIYIRVPVFQSWLSFRSQLSAVQHMGGNRWQVLAIHLGALTSGLLVSARTSLAVVDT